MSSVESEAVFSTRCLSVGLADADVTRLKGLGWCSFAAFAFSSAFQPGAPDEAPFLEAAAKVLGAPDHPKVAVLRRLLYESFTLTAADLKRRLERNDDDVPKSLPSCERAVRLARVSRTITGFKIQNEYEPSHALVDALAQQLDDGTIRYVPWDACAARSQEIDGIKKDAKMKMFTPDKNGFLKEPRKPEDEKASLATDLWVRLALTRRGRCRHGRVVRLQHP